MENEINTFADLLQAMKTIPAQSEPLYPAGAAKEAAVTASILAFGLSSSGYAHEPIPEQIFARMGRSDQKLMIQRDAELAEAAKAAGADHMQRSCHNPHADEPAHYSLQGFSGHTLVFDAPYAPTAR